jgi:aldose 1-epimerase
MGGRVTIEPFGRTSGNDIVLRITLIRGGMRAAVLTYGAALHSVRFDRLPYDLTLQSGEVAGYEGTHCYHGTIVGPVANRLGQGRFRVGGQAFHLDGNEASGHLLHGGVRGTQARVWEVEAADDVSATLSLTLEDDGFPGTRHLRATYALTADATLQLTLTATTDAPSLMNLAQHGYWNLDGTETWDGHTLQIAADHYLPTDATCLPTGDIRPVSGTDFDFREARQIGIGAPFIDNNFCLAHAPAPLRDVVWLTGKSGLRLTFATTEPGVQVFNGPQGWRGDKPHGGIAIEAQGWPDAPNQPGFPSIALNPGETYSQTTRWKFDRV